MLINYKLKAATVDFNQLSDIVEKDVMLLALRLRSLVKQGSLINIKIILKKKSKERLKTLIKNT